MKEFVKHYVVDMDESMVQCCIFCGEIISDYRGIMYVLEEGPPKGWATGEIFVLDGFPKILTSFLDKGTPFKKCS